MGLKNKFFQWLKMKDVDGAPKTLEELKGLLESRQLGAYFEQLKSLVRNALTIELKPTLEADIPLGQSKIGGQPDLPETIKWPLNELGEALSFIAQINLSETTDSPTSQLLPKEGILYFFYCADQQAWGYDPGDSKRFRVLYSEQTNQIRRHPFPEQLKKKARFPSNSIHFSAMLSLPGWEHELTDTIFPEDAVEQYLDLSDAPEYQLLGYANCIQGPMELDCQLVTNGISCATPKGYKDPRRKALEKGMQNWQLLFQIGSQTEKTGMNWGDGGRLYFWIRGEDLKNRNFDKSWFISQSH